MRLNAPYASPASNNPDLPSSVNSSLVSDRHGEVRYVVINSASQRRHPLPKISDIQPQSSVAQTAEVLRLKQISDAEAAKELELKKITDAQAVKELELKIISDTQIAKELELKRIADAQTSKELELKRILDFQATKELELTKVANMQEIAALQLKKITDAQSSERLRLEAEALRLKSASAEEKNTETALVARELKLNKTADTQSVKASQLSEVARQQDVRKLELDRVTKEQSTEKSRLEALTKELAVEKARLKEAENKVVAAELKLQKEAERKADEELRSKKAEEKKIVDELRLKKAAERKAAEKLKSEEDEKIEAERKEIAKLKQEQDRIEKEKKRAEAIQKRFDNAGSEFIKLYAGKKVELDTIFSSLHAKIIPENKRIDVLNADYQILADFYILFDMLNDLRNKESLAETSMIFIVYQHACLMRKAYLSKNLLNSHETVKAFLLNFLKVYESTPVQFNETLTEIVNKLSYHYGLLKNLQMKCKLQEIVLSPETTELTGAVSQRILLLVNSLIQNEIHNIKHVISKEDHRYIVDNVKKIQDEISAALLSVPKNQLVEEAPDAKLLTAVQAGLFKANALIAERRASIDKKVAEYSAIYSRKKDCLAANMAVFNQHSTSTLVRHNLFVSFQVVTDTCDLIARGVDAAENLVILHEYSRYILECRDSYFPSEKTIKKMEKNNPLRTAFSDFLVFFNELTRRPNDNCPIFGDRMGPGVLALKSTLMDIEGFSATYRVNLSLPPRALSAELREAFDFQEKCNKAIITYFVSKLLREKSYFLSESCLQGDKNFNELITRFKKAFSEFSSRPDFLAILEKDGYAGVPGRYTDDLGKAHLNIILLAQKTSPAAKKEFTPR